MIHSIGAEVVDSLEQAATATRKSHALVCSHDWSVLIVKSCLPPDVIASDGKAKLRRTPKLMICICKTSNILSVDWLGKKLLLALNTALRFYIL